MASFWDKGLSYFKRGSMVTRLIIIQVVVFLLLRLALVFLQGNVAWTAWLMRGLELPAEWAALARNHGLF